jgi:hypothetical protein
MKFIGLAIAVLALTVAPSVADQSPKQEWDKLHTFYDGTWVCSTPATYDEATERAKSPEGGLRALRAELLEAKKCLYVEEKNVEDMLAPFVQIVERDGNLVQVRFTIEYYRKIELLHRNITRMTFVGWTENANLRDYHEWLTGKPQT